MTRLSDNLEIFLQSFSDLADSENSQVKVEGMVTSFINFISSAANQLFVKNHVINNNVEFKQTFREKIDKAVWYNDTCKEKKILVRTKITLNKQNKTSENRVALLKAKKDYKYFCEKCRLQFQKERCAKMNELWRNSPREFWKFFENKNFVRHDNVTLEQFYRHFKNLASSELTTEDQDIEAVLQNFDSERNHNVSTPTFEELDAPVTIEEIERCVKTLSRNKNPGLDELLNEYFIEAIGILSKPFGNPVQRDPKFWLFSFWMDKGYYYTTA